MKTTQAKKLKTKALKIGPKQTKAKLPQYKSKNRFNQEKRKLFVETSKMNRSSAKCKNVQESSSTEHSLTKEQLVAQYTLKRRRKKSPGQNEVQHSMGFSSKTSKGSTEAPLAGRRDDNRYQKILEQRNIGSPVIIEALLDNFSSLSIPAVFKQSQRAKRQSNDSNVKPLDTRGIGSEVNETCVFVAKPSYSNKRNNNGTNDTIMAQEQKTHRKAQKDKTVLPHGSINNPSNSQNTRKYAERKKPAGPSNNDAVARRNSLLGEATLCESNVDSDHSLIRFYSLSNKVVVVMPENAHFCFTGKLILRVLYGAIETYGCTVTTESGPIEVYSPRGYSNVSIKTSEKYSQTSVPDIWETLSAAGVYRKEKSKLAVDIEQIKPGTAVLFLSNLENKLTKFLNNFYPLRLFPKIKSAPHFSWTHPKRAEAVLQSNIYVGNYACKELITDPRIAQDVADKMCSRWRANEWSCALMAGGKSVGKSTATRYLINSLLPVSKRAILLDVDPGQTECTPPGCISYSLIEQPLIGPNFTHLKTPVYQVYIGDVNVSRCITRYIEGIKMLFDKLTSCPILSRLPIVVNTMGFTHGIGWDIVLFTIKLIRPSFVVQIMSEKPKNNYTGYLSKQVVNRQGNPWASYSTTVTDFSQPCDHELIVARSQAEQKNVPRHDAWNMQPYQQRELVMISYLGGIVQDSADSPSWYDGVSLSINDAVPYVAPFSSLFISIPQASVPPTHVLNVVNGNIVALCGIDVENESLNSEVTSNVRVLTRSPLCTCYGFGIIRGVDMEREEIFINTPLPIFMMRYVNCLVGCIPVPTTLLQSEQQKDVAPYVGGSDLLPMSREHRRGYFRMRYQNTQNSA